MIRPNVSIRTILIVAAFCLLTIQLDAATYKVFPLSAGSSVNDLNNKGEFVGKLFEGPFVYLPEAAYGLPAGFTILEPPYDNPYLTTANAMNDSGVIVGLADKKMVQWVGGVPAIIDFFSGGATTPFDINNSGVIFGNTTGWGARRPFMQVGSNLTNLAPYFDACYAILIISNSINDSTDMYAQVGCKPDEVSPYSYTNFIWHGTSVDTTQYFNESFKGYDINNNGQLVGNESIDGKQFAAIYENDQLTLLPQDDSILYAVGLAINDHGHIVGRANSPSGGKSMAALWLQEDAYGLSAGFHILTNLAPDLDSLTLTDATDINNAGQIVCKAEGPTGPWYTYILTPYGHKYTVNSTDDDPDIDPGDGECNTGGPEVSGKPECTMRAAIMETNARAGFDTIYFDIPVEGVPVIYPTSELPHLTDMVLIDGSSQSGQDFVELDGIMMGGPIASGLTLSAHNSTIRNLMINRFVGGGLTLNGADTNKVHDLIIGSDSSGTENRGNLLHGIHLINSTKNRIGPPSLPHEGSNIIAHNFGIGIFIESGEYNELRGNSIFDNGGLGIDLAPLGVNASDSLKDSVGANGNIKAPIIDGVIFYEPDELIDATIYGRIFGEQDTDYNITLFFNEVCDPSGYGEGKIRSIGETVNTGYLGAAQFSINVNIWPDSAKYVAALATDITTWPLFSAGHTSEFSACWPKKKLKIVDANGDSLAQKSFILSKISNDPPIFTDSLIDTVVTDSEGYVDLEGYYLGDKLNKGDSIQVWQLLHTEYSAKHPTLVASAYRVILDNAKFNELGAMSYDKLDGEYVQSITLDHTTLEYSLVVSIEWDADLDYITSLEQGFRNMANYLYDVSDGQIRFDTIAIYDSKENWDYADIQIGAKNTIIPHVDRFGGISRDIGENSDPIELPRKWFGNETASRNGTFNEHPLDLTQSDSYRSIAHEFGHFALYLRDEYVFVSGGVRCAEHPLSPPNWKPYGFMDYHYEEGLEYSSEMSSANAYITPECQNTRHWGQYTQSTWQTVESLFQKTYDGILSPILRPSERALPAGLDYMPGPNNNIGNPEYNVGALVIFPVTHIAPVAKSLKVRFFEEAQPNSDVKPNIYVSLVDTTYPQTVGTIHQGNTSDDGGIWLIGRLPEHQISGWGYHQILEAPKHAGNGGRAWFYNGEITEYPDSAVIGMVEVQGDKSVISHIQLGTSELIYRLETPNPFQSEPQINLIPDGGSESSYSFISEVGGYGVTINDSLYGSGVFNLTAVDDSGKAYSFDAAYSLLTMESGTVNEMMGPGGISEASLDNTSNSLARAMLLSTWYPVLRNGLDPLSLQGGPVQSLAVYPELPFDGENNITIRYSDADIIGDNGVFSEEESLRIFHWNEAGSTWEQVGGSVDTFFNTVTSSITEAGVYGAFTTENLSDVGFDDTEPQISDMYELSQNYPNPFNPSTNIRYNLPKKSHVEISIYNILGQRVRILENETKAAGNYEIFWDGTDQNGNMLATGIYLYRIEAGEFIETRKMLLLK